MKRHVRIPIWVCSRKEARERAIKKYKQVRDAEHSGGCWHFVVVKMKPGNLR